MKIRKASIFLFILIMAGSSMGINERFPFYSVVTENCDEEERTETEVDANKSLIYRSSRKSSSGRHKTAHEIYVDQSNSFPNENSKSGKKTIHQKNFHYKPELYILYCSLKLDFC